MKRILSIDWDYFVDCSANDRFNYFPDGGNEDLPYEIQDLVWNIRYANYPTIFDMGVLKEAFDTVHNILKRVDVFTPFAHPEYGPLDVVRVAESHRCMYEFTMMRTDKDEEFEVYNIDFHHDMYSYRTKNGEVNCGNWVNVLLEQRPNMKYHWIKREDSDTQVLGGEVDCLIKSLQDIKDLDFDYVFICRSDCWSPPHLDKQFLKLWRVCIKDIHSSIEMDNYVTKVRDVRSTPSDNDILKQMASQNEKLYTSDGVVL